MSDSSSSSSNDLEIALVRVLPIYAPADRKRDRKKRESEDDSPFSYEMKLGRQTIRLDPIEYRILSFLAARPYQAFTSRRIAEAASTEQAPVTEGAVRRYVASLRAKLGFFSDFIQTVPYIGYRFKA